MPINGEIVPNVIIQLLFSPVVDLFVFKPTDRHVPVLEFYFAVELPLDIVDDLEDLIRLRCSAQLTVIYVIRRIIVKFFQFG